MTRMRLSCVFACLLAACTGSETERSRATMNAKPPSRNAADSMSNSFILVSIGGAQLRTRAAASRECDETPFYGRYELSSGTWSNVDSVFASCAAGAEATSMSSSGRFVMRADTIDLFVPDTNVGVRGLVQRGLLRGDTLTLWNSDLDGGDYKYVRRSLN